MALYRFSVSMHARSAGRSAVAAAAYRAGAQLRDPHTGLTHDYRRRRGVLGTEILAPAGAPAWATQRASLWAKAELAERRKDAQTAREIVLSLPRELSEAQNTALVRDFVSTELVAAHGMVADVAWHAAHSADGQVNVHAHLLMPTRRVEANGFAAKKAREWNARELVVHWREAWAAHVNAALAASGVTAERVDHRSLAVRRTEAEERATEARVHGDEETALGYEADAHELARPPEPKRGRAHPLEARGVITDQGALVREIRDERTRRRQLAERLRALVQRAAQARLQLGERLRQGLTPALLASLRESNLGLAVRGRQPGLALAVGDGEQALAREREQRREGIERHRIEQGLQRVRAAMRRDRGRGIGR
ncbi:MobA/MobL family protein [Methylobacterium sp. E-041]|uniref:MobQ family relaxase n=1 Tax=Methylobacterium sp. E-041 TaxID=2836573 RepID=UPI001FBA8C13|nr:MobQ family relaxase [Methylobacterium sp. E-041]MCJ2103830.1 MobA/MobL family protein [Methylobacterium sp. E-041]